MNQPQRRKAVRIIKAATVLGVPRRKAGNPNYRAIIASVTLALQGGISEQAANTAIRNAITGLDDVAFNGNVGSQQAHDKADNLLVAALMNRGDRKSNLRQARAALQTMSNSGKSAKTMMSPRRKAVKADAGQALRTAQQLKSQADLLGGVRGLPANPAAALYSKADLVALGRIAQNVLNQIRGLADNPKHDLDAVKRYLEYIITKNVSPAVNNLDAWTQSQMQQMLHGISLNAAAVVGRLKDYAQNAGKSAKAVSAPRLARAQRLQQLLKGWSEAKFDPALGKQALQLATDLQRDPQAKQYAEDIVRNLPMMIRDAEQFAKQEGYPPRASSVSSLAQTAGMIVHALQSGKAKSAAKASDDFLKPNDWKTRIESLIRSVQAFKINESQILMRNCREYASDIRAQSPRAATYLATAKDAIYDLMNAQLAGNKQNERVSKMKALDALKMALQESGRQ